MTQGQQGLRMRMRTRAVLLRGRQEEDIKMCECLAIFSPFSATVRYIPVLPLGMYAGVLWSVAGREILLN